MNEGIMVVDFIANMPLKLKKADLCDEQASREVT